MEGETNNLNPLINDLVREGLVDWVDAAELISRVREFLLVSEPTQVRELSLLVLTEVLRRGLMEVGDLVDRGPLPVTPAFRPWGLDESATLSRIRRVWMQLGRAPEIWELFWLENTALGDELARRGIREDGEEGKCNGGGGTER